MLRSLFTIVLVLLCMGRAHAVGIWDYTHRADLICVATFDSLRPVEWEPRLASGALTTYAITMNVREVWKGEWTEPQVTVYLARWEFDGPFTPFKPFTPKRNYLILAKRNSNNRFTNGKQGFFSYFPLAEPVSAQPNQPAMTRVTRQLIANLLSADLDLKNKAFFYLPDYEGVFVDDSSWIKTQFPADEVSAAKSLLTTQAIPEILRLAREGDEQTRVAALLLAPWLQQTVIISQLAQEAQEGKSWSNSMAWGLFHFHNREALPLLRAQLGNTNPTARLAIVEAFEEFRDPVTIPDLKKLLADPDKEVAKRAAYALGLFGG
jgi:hypothetical protein